MGADYRLGGCAHPVALEDALECKPAGGQPVARSLQRVGCSLRQGLLAGAVHPFGVQPGGTAPGLSLFGWIPAVARLHITVFLPLRIVRIVRFRSNRLHKNGNGPISRRRRIGRSGSRNFRLGRIGRSCRRYKIRDRNLLRPRVRA